MAKPLVTIVFLFNMIGAAVFSIFWVKNIKLELGVPSEPLPQYNWIITDFKTLARDLFPLDSYQAILAFLSILFFAQYIIKSILEFLAEYTPVNLPQLTKLFYNLVQSGLLYTMILGFIIAPMFIENYQLEQQSIAKGETAQIAYKYSQKLILLLLETFFYSRILFAAGYLIGVLTGLESFRAYGVGLTLAPVVVGFSYVYDLPVWNYF